MRGYPKKTQTRTYVDVHYRCFSHRMEEGKKPCDEPKFVIFYNMLVAIFQLFCFHCKCNNPSIEVCKIGKMASVTQKCNHCGKLYKWKSQPSMFGRHPAGNAMLSFGILTSGAKISQALLMFKNMGLCYFSADILLPPKEVPVPLGVKLLENSTINTS